MTRAEFRWKKGGWRGGDRPGEVSMETELDSLKEMEWGKETKDSGINLRFPA
jgi:hypothetical protein